MAKKVLIAYYSRRGENYVNGSIVNLKLGNTEVVAQKIKALLPDADMFQIDTTYEYSKSYMTCIEEAKKELHDQVRPEVKNPLENIDEYDTIILGYPNWWGTMPMVCYTFLESYDFTGKHIIPFCTMNRCAILDRCSRAEFLDEAHTAAHARAFVGAEGNDTFAREVV